jgi:hypothetical protein
MIRKNGNRFSLGTKREAFCPEIMLKQKVDAQKVKSTEAYQEY